MDPSSEYPEIGPEASRTDWHWWARLGVVLVAAIAAVLLILVGAARFLDQAQREHDRVECVRAQVQAQARGTVVMASAVLDLTLSVDQRRAAVVSWAQEQGGVAERIGRC